MNIKQVTTQDDIIALEALASRIWKTYWSEMLTIEQAEYMFEKFQSLDAIKEQINEGYIYKIISVEGMNAGYFCIVQKDDHLYLSKVYVDEVHRGKGLGRIMFEDIKNIAQKINLPKIRLNVNKYNSNTIKAYDSWGFIIIDSVVIDIGQGFIMDDYVMECDLSL